MTHEQEVILAYRCLVAELLRCPNNPCMHEGTDFAVHDFENEGEQRLRHRMRQLMDNTMRQPHERVSASIIAAVQGVTKKWAKQRRAEERQKSARQNRVG